MTNQPKELRTITDDLDAVGNYDKSRYQGVTPSLQRDWPLWFYSPATLKI